MNKVLISLYDHSGNQSRPYRQHGWYIEQIDIKHGRNIMDFDPYTWLRQYLFKNPCSDTLKIGILAPIPCTCYALSGNRHKKKRLITGEFSEAQKLVEKTRLIIEWFAARGYIKFWMIENPSSDIHKHNPWLGDVVHKFNPCDYAGYAPEPEKDRYNKQTWLWGRFDPMIKKRLEPIEKDSPIWRNYGGKSEKTKELRSITPLGFAYAFYEANH